MKNVIWNCCVFIKKRSGFALYAYCLMGNHVHLLIKEAAYPAVITIENTDVETGEGEPLDIVMKRINVAYASYFNRKYGRVGHLFQDRFRSEPVETDGSLLRVLRYIHRNPVKAGMCMQPEHYPKSSCNEYMRECPDSLVDTDLVLGMLTREELREFTCRDNEDDYLDITEEKDLPKSDMEATAIMEAICGCASAPEFQMLEVPMRKQYLRRLYSEVHNISQIARITGLSREIVYRAVVQ